MKERKKKKIRRHFSSKQFGHICIGFFSIYLALPFFLRSHSFNSKAGICFTMKFSLSLSLTLSLPVSHLTKSVKYSQWITHCKRRTRMLNVSLSVHAYTILYIVFGVCIIIIHWYGQSWLTLCFHYLIIRNLLFIFVCNKNRASFSILEFIE